MGSSRLVERVRPRSTILAIAIGFLGIAAAAPALGATVVWAGGSGVWSTAGNWVGGVAPTSSDVAAFSGWAPLSRIGWVASASATNGGDPVTNAIDGLTTGRWSTGAGQVSGQWFKVDMGSAQTVNGVTVDAGANTNDYPGGFDVYVSDDDVSYGGVIASATGTALVSLAFTAQTARYIKLVMNTNSNNAHWWSISELNVFGSTGGTELARSSWSATAAVTGGADVASNAVDNVTSTYWTTGANQIAPQWLKIDMQSAQTFTTITIDAAADTNDYPRGYAIYAYNTDDGLHDGSAIAIGAGSAALVTVNVSSRTARYVKVVQTAAFNAQWWSVHELNVLNGASTLSRTGDGQ
jgi:F5/8 type C domain